MSDTNRGILTEKQREFLKTAPEEREEKYSRQVRHRRGKTIRQRVENGMTDLTILAAHADDELLEDVFGKRRGDVDDGEPWLKDSPAWRALVQGISFFIAAARAGWHDPTATAGDSSELLVSPLWGSTGGVFDAFERRAEGGVADYLERRHGVTAESISVDITVRDLKTVSEYRNELLDRDGPVTGTDRIEAVARLARAGYTDEEIIDTLGDPEDIEGDPDDGE